jgi:hypothetical protein
MKEEIVEGDLKELTSVHVTCSFSNYTTAMSNITKGQYDQ